MATRTSRRRQNLVAINTTARPLQLIWAGDGDGVAGLLLGPGDDFIFEFKPGRPITLEIATPVSADGTMLRAGDNDQLYTADGVWTFGEDVDGVNAKVRLNGVQPNAYLWAGSVMMVDRGGILHLRNGEGMWVWTPRRFTKIDTP